MDPQELEADELSRLRAELAAIQADGLRYRWLRTNVQPKLVAQAIPLDSRTYPHDAIVYYEDWSALDAVIDAALSPK